MTPFPLLMSSRHSRAFCSSAESPLVMPVFEYTHADGCSITGGHVYRGTAAPTLAGRYFFADFCGTWVRSFRVSDGEAVDVMDHTVDFGPISQITSFGEDALGELYIVSLGGEVYRIGPA